MQAGARTSKQHQRTVLVIYWLTVISSIHQKFLKTSLQLIFYELKLPTQISNGKQRINSLMADVSTMPNRSNKRVINAGGAIRGAACIQTSSFRGRQFAGNEKKTYSAKCSSNS